MAISTSLIVSVGAPLQKSVFSAISSDTPNLYRAAYEEQIVDFPSLFNWFATGLAWYNLLIGAIICLAALSAPTMERALTRVTFVTALTLTINDWRLATFYTGFHLTSELANLVANLIGGLAIAALLGTALALFCIVRDTFSWSRAQSLVTAAFSLIAFGAALSATTYFALRAIYQPAPAEISVSLSPPVSGYYGVKDHDVDSASGIRSIFSAFNLIPPKPIRGGLSVNAQGALTTHWTKATSSTEYDLEVRLFSDCTKPQASNLPKIPAAFKKLRLSELALMFDDGTTALQLAVGNNRTFTLDSPLNGVFSIFRIFSITRSEIDHSLAIQQIAGTDTKTIVHSPDAVELFVTASLWGTQGVTFQPVTRTLTIQTDEVRHRARFSTSSPSSDNSEPSCHPIALGDSDWPAEGLERSLSARSISALITIAPRLASDPLRSSSTILTVGPYRGFTSITDIPSNTLAWPLHSRLSTLMVSGGLSDLAIDGANLKLYPSGPLLLTGDFQAAFLDNDIINISGKASAISDSNHRINRTKWELLSSELQITCITALFAVAVAYAKWLWPKTRSLLKNEPQSFVD